MTTSTANLGMPYLQTGQLQPEVTINQDLDIIDSAIGSQSSAFGYDAATSTGLTYGYFGGPILVNGIDTLIAAGKILLAASATNYVQRTAAGAVSANQTGFTLGLIPMAIVTTSSSAITLPVLDRRPSAYDRQGRQVITTTGGALTLTSAQANAKILSIQGVLTSNSVLTLPNLQQDWTISNETTGAFTLTAQIGAGTPIPVGQGLARRVYGNGTTLLDADRAKAELNGDSTQIFRGANAAGVSDLVPYGQADSRYVLSSADGSGANKKIVSASLTLAVSDSGKTIDPWRATAGSTITLPINALSGAPDGFNVLIGPNQNGINLALQAAQLTSLYAADGSTLIGPGGSLVLPAGMGRAWRVCEFANSYRIEIIGRTVVSNAVNSNEALARGQSITNGTRTDVTASRAVSTTYTNSLARPIKIYIAGTSTASNAWLARQIGTGTVFYAEISNSGNHVTLELLVMPGETYTITSNNVTINVWEEIR